MNCHWCLAVLWLVPAGCGVVSPPYHGALESLSLPTKVIRPTSSAEEINKKVAYQTSCQPESPLSLEQLLALAAQHHPDLAIVQARAEAARGRLVQAGLYPNPEFNWEADNMMGRARAGEQGPHLTQEIVTADKLRLAQEAAAQGVAVADWQAITQWYDRVTQVRQAYVDLLTARQEVETNQENVHLAQDFLEAATKLKDKGAGTQPDVLRAQVEVDQALLHVELARQHLETAARQLATAVGLQTLPAVVDAGLDGPVPAYEWQPIFQAVLTRSSEIQEARASYLQAGQQLHQAEAERVPNVRVGIRPFYTFEENNARLLVEAGTALPLFNRNQGNILAAQADLARAGQEIRQKELRLTERLATAFQNYQAARTQVEAYDRHVLPNARESLRLMRRGYESGAPQYNYTAVLEAQRTLVQARLARVQAVGDLWRAIGDIAGLLQEDPASLHCPQSSTAPANHLASFVGNIF